MVTAVQNNLRSDRTSLCCPIRYPLKKAVLYPAQWAVSQGFIYPFLYVPVYKKRLYLNISARLLSDQLNVELNFRYFKLIFYSYWAIYPRKALKI